MGSNRKIQAAVDRRARDIDEIDEAFTDCIFQIVGEDVALSFDSYDEVAVDGVIYATTPTPEPRDD